MPKPKTDRRTRLPHPMQPVALDADGIARFKENKIISYLLEQVRAHEPMFLNRLCAHVLSGMFTREDYEQFNQLIGYSVCGFCEFDDDTHRAKVKDAAWDAMEALDVKKTTGKV